VRKTIGKEALWRREKREKIGDSPRQQVSGEVGDLTYYIMAYSRRQTTYEARTSLVEIMPSLLPLLTAPSFCITTKFISKIDGH
jgi:hypothetical protein